MTVRRMAALAIIAAAWACGSTGSQWPTLHATAPWPQKTAVRCAMLQAKSLGYKAATQNSYRSVTGTKPDSTKFVDEFRRWTVLSLDATPADAGGTNLALQVQSKSQYQSRAGPYERDNPASSASQQEAKQILDRCASGDSSALHPDTAVDQG